MSGLTKHFVNEQRRKSDGMTFLGVSLCAMDEAELFATAPYLMERLLVLEGHLPPLLRTPPKKPATSFVITVTGGEQ